MAKHRLTKVTTRAGDKGTTKLATGKTVTKDHAIVLTMGSIDELNAFVGSLLSVTAADHQVPLKQIQQDLFDMGAVFAMEGSFDPPALDALENLTATLNETLPPLTEFVLPGGGESASRSHICRTVCRRAEAQTWALINADSPPAYSACAQYLNRLSDYFFVLARALTETAEEQWQGPDRGS
ncbi:MAG: cob(I)yrinic acid a,c-diamide adenosyltransferase [Pseudomonadota bacterium]